jgi:hypothetical protein
MEHANGCAACGLFWSELQAAQRLTLRLRQPSVGDDFRERLWDRIHAGEGTPEAVFREPVPMWTKVRYTLTGAAAAAAVLVGAAMLRQQDAGSVAPSSGAPSSDRVVADAGTNRSSDGRSSDGRGSSHGATNMDRSPTAIFAGSGFPGGSGGSLADRDAALLASSPLISSAQPLTFNLVALETAKQLEQRYAAMTTAVRRIDDPASNREMAIRQAFENADEFRAFGELLLDLHERQRLFFTDNRVEADLRSAVNMVTVSRKLRPDVRATQMLELVLRSDLLPNVSRTISVVPDLNQHAELDALQRLNTQRPEVFIKLFIPLGDNAAICQDLGLVRHGFAFFMFDACGPSWVAPRSEVEARGALSRVLRERFAGEVENAQRR